MLRVRRRACQAHAVPDAAAGQALQNQFEYAERQALVFLDHVEEPQNSMVAIENRVEELENSIVPLADP